MPIQRLSRLSDIIFAVAMTILTLVFDPIPLDQTSPEMAAQLLLQQLPDMGIYAITFLTIALYWFTHVNQFKYYQKTDAVHTFLSLFLNLICGVLTLCQQSLGIL
ncbi:MAG: TMEM175 family protein [Cyanobacteria bacterium P01_A01_bin.80]